jgi:hypothetical protein
VSGWSGIRERSGDQPPSLSWDRPSSCIGVGGCRVLRIEPARPIPGPQHGTIPHNGTTFENSWRFQAGKVSSEKRKISSRERQ